jgi:hypothetical protein
MRDICLNAEHWAVGEPGYHLADRIEPVSSPAPSPCAAAGGELTRGSADRPDLAIPDDLSIPAFLRRAP